MLVILAPVVNCTNNLKDAFAQKNTNITPVSTKYRMLRKTLLYKKIVHIMLLKVKPLADPLKHFFFDKQRILSFFVGKLACLLHIAKIN